MKGIVLAGGSGTRLYPITMAVSKQLLPIYDKPMIYYPISTLMHAGIREILIISTPTDISKFENLLGDGSMFGIRLSYAVQQKPDGLAQALTIGEEFIGDDSCALILGDNIFFGGGFKSILKNAISNANNGNATIFGYYVDDPQRFGIMEYDENWNILSVEEKPKKPKSNYCITGLYFYPRGVSKYAHSVPKSKRGEYEITTLNDIYLKEGKLKGEILGRGFAWMDTGTMDSLIEASEFVQIVEKRQGIMIAALEEIAYRQNWITKEELIKSAAKYGKSSYGQYLKKIAEGKVKY